MSMPFIRLTPFLLNFSGTEVKNYVGVNALHQAYSISTPLSKKESTRSYSVSMPFIRLTPFLRYPLEPLCLCGFPDLFLQVIHRIFWKFTFLGHFFVLSALIRFICQSVTKTTFFYSAETTPTTLFMKLIFSLSVSHP